MGFNFAYAELVLFVCDQLQSCPSLAARQDRAAWMAEREHLTDTQNGIKMYPWASQSKSVPQSVRLVVVAQ